jgi:signal peptidase complex subunit 2
MNLILIQSPKFNYINPTEVIVEDDGEEVVYTELPQPHVIETGDSVKVKQVLDDATTEILTNDAGFIPNYNWDNLKLLLMFLSCVFAMLAQFYPIPFPASRPLLGVCCAMYFILSTVLQFMITYIDKDIILMSKPEKVRQLASAGNILWYL